MPDETKRMMDKHLYIHLLANLFRLVGNLAHLVSLTLLESIGEKAGQPAPGPRKAVETIEPKGR
jgi:hypothetical protein